MKAMFPATDKVGEFHVFDIGGNKLRLIASVQYRMQRVYIEHLLDHRDYEKDKWKEKNR
ncbi:mRNA interferase HigB [Pseudomonas sp. 34 E 7]|nr:mRNA interferase HigB [Pseudomonas sp. 44 R 15]CRN00207.1 mRNA interferase HigB [Pseudomonas sp. 34 E 7]